MRESDGPVRSEGVTGSRQGLREQKVQSGSEGVKESSQGMRESEGPVNV